MRRYPKLLLYLGYLNLAVWRCYISFLSRWCGSDVLLYGGLHTYSFVYVVDPFACRLRRPFLSRCLEMVGTAERSTCVGIWAPPYYFNHFRTSRLESRSVIHRGSYSGLVVGVVTAVVQLLLTIVHHEAKVVQLSLQLGVVWGFQWLSICITPWAKLKASTLDLIDALPTQTGKSFLHCSSKSIEPVVFPQGELNSLRSGRFSLSSETCNN